MTYFILVERNSMQGVYWLVFLGWE